LIFLTINLGAIRFKFILINPIPRRGRGVRAGGYTFPVGDFHLLFFASFLAHSARGHEETTQVIGRHDSYTSVTGNR
jgi:hypothetical protein